MLFMWFVFVSSIEVENPNLIFCCLFEVNVIEMVIFNLLLSIEVSFEIFVLRNI